MRTPGKSLEILRWLNPAAAPRIAIGVRTPESWSAVGAQGAELVSVRGHHGCDHLK
jgi:thiamine monophosphate synthase